MLLARAAPEHSGAKFSTLVHIVSGVSNTVWHIFVLSIFTNIVASWSSAHGMSIWEMEGLSVQLPVMPLS